MQLVEHPDGDLTYYFAAQAALADKDAQIAALEARLAASDELAKECAYLGLVCGTLTTQHPYRAPEVIWPDALDETEGRDSGWIRDIVRHATARTTQPSPAPGQGE